MAPAGSGGPGEPAAPGGQCAALVRDLDWAATPLGPAQRWPPSLRFAVRTVLSSRYPMLLLWGEELTQLYNDAYAELIGDKHPAAMGDDVRVTLAEGWDVLAPLIREATATGTASWVPALQLLLERSGYREEAYFSVSHAPARDDDGRTVGVLTVCSEVTAQVVQERRLRLLRDLSLRSGQVLDVASGLAELQAALSGQELDVPVAAVYLRHADVLQRALVVGRALDGEVADVLPAQVRLGEDDPWGVAAAGAGRSGERPVPPGTRVPGGPWGDLVETAVALPLASDGAAEPLGVLVVGLSPSRALDEAYASFVDVMAQQVGAALRKAQAYEQERRRAEVLAELDRAKTQFFTNVSHEFRTPLTLLLGPLEDALQDGAAPLPDVQRERLETAHRGAQRLLRLVDDLLSFSSLEAGRQSATPVALDLAAATAEHASTFRAAVERAGLRLVVDCPALPGPVRVDPAHWETVVTNLLSNALKFTFVGSIAVRLRSTAEAVVLEVADTGIGVPPEAVAGLFDRFSRVQGARGRSHEGSGIGLALVAELTRLAGGEVAVDSAPGRGSTFTVTLPWSAVAALPGEPAAPAPQTGQRARAAAQEAMAWDAPATAPALPQPAEAGAAADPELAGAVVLVADDNRDLRGYLARLLEAAGCTVVAVGDGEAALAALRARLPDLLLTDVMMPGLDGFALLQAVRRDPSTAALPVVVLSARAGPQAGVEGLELGADDYLVKPFRSEELLARVRGTLRMARLRSAHRAQLAAVAETTAVLSRGAALEPAVREVVEQARALLGARRVRALLHVAGGELEVASPPPPAEDGAEPDAAVPVQVDGAQLGAVQVWGRLDELTHPLLLPVAAVLAALVSSGAGHDREVAATLRRSLLPDRLPDVPGLELAGSSLPAAEVARVGGDWYDVLPLDDGRVAVSIGDAAGSGVAAATAMGQLRGAVRAYVLQRPEPDAVLRQLAALSDRLGTTTFATVWLGVLDPGTGVLTWSSAGHPPALLLAPGAPPRWLTGDTAPPVGAPLDDLPVPVTTTALPEQARLLLFTDGLVEDRATQLDAGPEAVLRLAAAATDAGAGADALVEAALAARPGRDDDVAVLALRRLPAAPPPDLGELDRTTDYPAEPRSAGLVRRDLRAALAAAGVPEDAAQDLLLAASEAVANAVEHAQAPSRPEVQVRLAVSGSSCRITVSDYGGWRERPAAMDRGRGSALMAAAGEVRVVASAGGTTVTIEHRWDAGAAASGPGASG